MPTPSIGPEKHRQRRLAAELEGLQKRIEAVEHRQVLLRNALDGLARTSGVSVGCPCSHCDRSYVLIEAGMMYCPTCGDRTVL
ncbi:hypothetical protein ACFQGT_09075 [Natrialbaceae archaeon GCM10025810]|uniref:hypothetical protein n=1 Tax=Halovalidus salilacus TaxID=3075124 RepID=UPI00360C3650